MKVSVLVDNTAGKELRGEWGLSFFIEYNGKKVLLDAGLSGLFAENASTMGLDLKAVDYSVLSHAHDDHANGLEDFLRINDHAPLFVAEGCEENCYDLNYDHHALRLKYAGIPKGIMKRYENRIIKSKPDMYIDDGIRLLAHTTPELDELGRNEKMYLRMDDFRFIPDDFRHEHSLIFELEDGVAVFNSCSHAGADNIINEAAAAYPGKRILAMIGGFHLFNKTEQYVRAFAERVRQAGAETLYTGHCTGNEAIEILKEELGDMVHTFYTGMVFEIPGDRPYDM